MPPMGRPRIPLDAGPHLARRLVGEGDRENPGRTCLDGGDEPGDAVGEHAGLPLPAPASTSAWPVSAVTAARCSSLSGSMM